MLYIWQPYYILKIAQKGFFFFFINSLCSVELKKKYNTSMQGTNELRAIRPCTTHRKQSYNNNDFPNIALERPRFYLLIFISYLILFWIGL